MKHIGNETKKMIEMTEFIPVSKRLLILCAVELYFKTILISASKLKAIKLNTKLNKLAITLMNFDNIMHKDLMIGP